MLYELLRYNVHQYCTQSEQGKEEPSTEEGRKFMNSNSLVLKMKFGFEFLRILDSYQHERLITSITHRHAIEENEVEEYRRGQRNEKNEDEVLIGEQEVKHEYE